MSKMGWSANKVMANVFKEEKSMANVSPEDRFMNDSMKI